METKTETHIQARNLAMPIFWLQLVADDKLRDMSGFQVGGYLVDSRNGDGEDDDEAHAFVVDPTQEQLPMLTDDEGSFELRMLSNALPAEDGNAQQTSTPWSLSLRRVKEKGDNMGALDIVGTLAELF